MLARGVPGCLCAGFLLAAPIAAPPAAAHAPPEEVTALAQRLIPSVVSIQTMAMTPQGRMFFDGAGSIIDSSGIILTNRHVIIGAYDITVTIPNVGPRKANAIFVSPGVDLALLKVDAGQKLPAVKLGDSDTVRIGDSVLLLGNPLGVGQSLSFGVVSALNRDLGETIYDHFIQTDAALNHGNSGGPMFNMAGEVIGMNSALISSPGNTGSIGLGYAMPINDAKFIVDQYLRTGTVIVSQAGFDAQHVTEDLAQAFDLDGPRGAIVTRVLPGGPAAGKVRQGDIILKVGDVDATDTREVARMIAATTPGKTLPFTLLRNGKQMTANITIGRLEMDPNAAMSVLGHPPQQSTLFATPSDPGMTLAAIDPALRQKYRLRPDQTGVVVTGVNERSVASQRKIATGDVIVAVGEDAVRTPDDVQRLLRDVAERSVSFAPLLIESDHGTHWVALPLEPDR